jgi:uncharacterized delta-60 repeat protein
MGAFLCKQAVRVLRLMILSLIPFSLFAQERWIYRYNGPGNRWDEAKSIVAGADSNLYVAGRSVVTGTFCDFTVVSLDPSGVERWVYRYNGPGDRSDEAYSIVLGSDGNLYAAGMSEGIGTFYDFTVISLDPSGVERWVYQYTGPGYDSDEAYSIAMGTDGNLYAAGYSEVGASYSDFTVVSLTDTGAERWVYRHDGPASGPDWANSVVMGSDGNLYAAGYTEVGGMYGDLTVVSLTDSGTERWVYRYDRMGGDDCANSIIMGSDGNLYAAGLSEGGMTWFDFTVVSLTASGGQRWVYRYNGPGNAWDCAHSVVMGPDGNLYAAGFSTGVGTSCDFTVVSLTASGGQRWVYQYNGPGDSFGKAYSIVVGPDGNIYAAGYSVGVGTSDDFMVVSLTDSGLERWVYRYDGPMSDNDGANSIVMGTDGNLYAAGMSGGIGTDKDLTVVSLMPGEIDAALVSLDSPQDTVFVDSTYSVRASVGNLGSVVVTFDVVATLDSYIDTVHVQNLSPDSSNQVVFEDWQVPPADSATYTMTVCTHAAGDIDTTNDCMQKTIFAYDPTGVQEENDRPVVSDFRLWENTPNPLQQSTSISYILPTATEVTLTIYDITGRVVETLVNETQQLGMHQIRWNRRDNPSGVYFYSLAVGEFVDRRKMVVVE